MKSKISISKSIFFKNSLSENRINYTIDLLLTVHITWSPPEIAALKNRAAVFAISNKLENFRVSQAPPLNSDEPQCPGGSSMDHYQHLCSHVIVHVAYII